MTTQSIQLTIHFMNNKMVCGAKNIPFNALVVDDARKGFNMLCGGKDVWLSGCSNDALLEVINRDFIHVRAAGGIVTNSLGEELMITRNGRWDLPKGMVERGESLAIAAMREVSEETGLALDGLSILELIGKTYHVYDLYGGWHLKQTSWFRMKYHGEALLRPQIEEDIEQCVWCTPKDRDVHLRSSYSTLQQLNSWL